MTSGSLSTDRSLAQNRQSASQQGDRLGVLAHWTLVANDRTGEPFDLIRDEQHAEAMRAGGWKLIEIVPADDYAGAVEALERVTDMLARVQDGDLHPGRNLAAEVARAQEALDRLGGR